MVVQPPSSPSIEAPLEGAKSDDAASARATAESLIDARMPAEEVAARRSSPRAARVTLGVLALLATALFLWVVSPFWSPLLLAAVLAAVFQRPLGRLTRSLGGRRRSAGALISLGVLIVIVMPFASIATITAREAISGFEYLRDTMGVQSVSDLKTAPLPPAAERALNAAHLTREQVHDFASRAATRAEEFGPELLKQSWEVFFHTVLMLLAFYFLLVDGPLLVRWLWSVSPLQARQTEELLTEFHNVATGAIVGNVTTALLQGALAGIGFAVFGVGRAFFFGLLTALASFVPVIGTALVWVPAVGVLALGGHAGAALGLGIWCLVGVVGVEHLAKPFILRATSGGEMHTGLMFLALLGGLEVFGLLGVILGPLIVSFFVSLMRMIERDAEAPSALH
jgi:predicted PurR-regulated permease PerM